MENAWLVPLIPAVSFVLILLFGKRMPKQGSELGILAVGSSFVLSVGAAIGWINRVNDAESAEGEHALGMVFRAMGRSVGRFSQEEGHAVLPVEPITRSITWLQSGGIKLSAGIQIDGLAVMMMFVVTLISLLVHIYSTEYMRGDRRYTHFFATLSLFTASMLLLVVSDNTLQLLVGWELVGLCSFILIGHWWEDKPNSDAAVKAFLTTRTGDIGLLCGVIMTFFVVQAGTGEGSFNIVALNDSAANAGELGVSHTLLLWTAVGLLAGIIGKSGQFPLHTWLPDAMAGPTPVSALIHAATMVVAGVYLGARVFPVFYEGFSIADGGVNPMALVGGITVIIGALLAFVQDDIKKVLAYSTVSQLGYMVLALGVGAWVAAIFHLFTHAFFKANLFLGAGSVSHSGSHHSFDMKKDMGGLRKYMPQTFWTFMIGTAALAGIPPLAGFWSKDEILVNAGENDFQVFLIVGMVGALLTAAYMTRCIYYTFFGEYRGGDHAHADGAGDELVEHHLAEVQDEHAHAPVAVATHDAHDDHAHAGPHESNWLITGPLWVLSAFSLGIGLLNAPGIEKFTEWFEPRFAFPDLPHAEFSVAWASAAVVTGLIGIGLSYAYYWRGLGPQRLSERNSLARAGKTFLVNKYYLDYLYENVIVAFIKGPLANAAYWFNQHVIDNVLNYTGRGAMTAGHVVYDYIDQKGVDGVVNGIGISTDEAGSAVREIQTGRLQFYAFMLVLALGVFALALWIAA
ncbi:MAG: NADH-quinone oxidoreductase subunit L [Acidimicrobiia bacterium]